MTVHQTASYAVRPESLERCLEAIRAFVEHVKSEPGTLSYIALQDANDETRFLPTMAFADESAVEAHANSEAVERFTSALYPETVEPVEFTTYRLVAGT